MYNVALKLHAIMNVKEHAERGAERQSDPRPRKELTCNWRRQQGQAILQYLYQNGIILIQTLKNGLTLKQRRKSGIMDQQKMAFLCLKMTTA